MNNRTKKLVFTAMFAVINYVTFTYGKITIPVTAGTSTAIHIANAIVVLSSWFLGPVYGGLAGAIGIIVPDALLGEVSPAMAKAVGESAVKKVLIPLNKCDVLIPGVEDKSTGELLNDALKMISAIMD